ncbi:MAG: ion transporter [Verrucomicrobiota bacterium]
MKEENIREECKESTREKLWRIIFLSDTPAGKSFDVWLLWLIGASVLVVMLETVESLESKYKGLFKFLEWCFTILFTIEYGLRIWIVRRKRRYIFSFFGMIDLLSILPSYLELLLVGTHYFTVIRILRLLRMFRVLKMARHMSEANILMNALAASRAKIAVFLFGVLSLVTLEGTLMYFLENELNPQFSSIPESMYWGIVTVTTVGYGNIVPVTVLGKIVASFMMMTGFAIIAVPTGIVSAELHKELSSIRMDTRECQECGLLGHDPSARYCKSCGTELQNGRGVKGDRPMNQV